MHIRIYQQQYQIVRNQLICKSIPTVLSECLKFLHRSNLRISHTSFHKNLARQIFFAASPKGRQIRQGDGLDVGAAWWSSASLVNCSLFLESYIWLIVNWLMCEFQSTLSSKQSNWLQNNILSCACSSAGLHWISIGPSTDAICRPIGWLWAQAAHCAQLGAGWGAQCRRYGVYRPMGGR